MYFGVRIHIFFTACVFEIEVKESIASFLDNYVYNIFCFNNVLREC